jgi:hypothetical protein
MRKFLIATAFLALATPAGAQGTFGLGWSNPTTEDRIDQQQRENEIRMRELKQQRETDRFKTERRVQALESQPRQDENESRFRQY